MKKGIIIGISIVSIIFLSYFLFFRKDEVIPFKDNKNKLIGIIDVINENTIDKYYKDNKFKTIDLGGEEKYLIIPNKNIEIKVYKLTMTEENDKEDYVETINKPFYLKCNESDIFSNVLLRFEYKNKEYEYSPHISLKDGSLVTKDFVLELK